MVDFFKDLVPSDQYDISAIRDEILLDYSLQLSSNNIPLSLITTYLIQCQTYGESTVAELILRQDFETEKDAYKLIKLCRVCGFDDRSAIQRRIRHNLFSRMMSKGLVLPALRIAPQLSQSVLEKVLEDIIVPNSSQGILNTNLTNVHNVNSVVSLMTMNSPEVAFLEYYSKALLNILDHNYHASLKVLSIALNEHMISKRFWMVLVADCIDLLPHLNNDVETEVVYKLIEALETVILENNKESKSMLELVLKKKHSDLKTGEVIEDMRITLAESLAYSFISQ